MYFPWLDYKWGYLVGVPVKNSLLTDIISQLYPWRDLAINIWKSGQIPLWNVYSFSGTPLLANWQSAVFYPLNLLMFLLGNGIGWSAIIILQPFLALVFTYLYLREIKISILPSVFGATIYSFSGFMMVYLEYNSAGQAAIWLPLILLILERYIKGKNYLLLPVLSFSFFFLLTSGNFQVSFYTILITFIYLCFRSIKDFKTIAEVAVFYILGLGLSAIQLIPTLELYLNSFRNIDNNIILNNYGLIPVKNIITFLAPDFFGNPVTGNGRGFIYQETAGYFGVLTIPFIISNLFKTKGSIAKFFGFALILSGLLVFDTPVGRLIYQLKVPLLSTSYASRALFLTDFCAAILAAFGLDALNEKKKKISIFGILLFAILAITFSVILIQVLSSKHGIGNLTATQVSDLITSLRNMVIPLGLVLLLLLSLKFIKKSKMLAITMILLTTIDLFKFGLKYNPFVPIRLLYPNTPVTDFLKQNTGYYRIDREKINILPPNTWIPYQLMSASGYDPLYSAEYANYYSVYNGIKPGALTSRYAELDNYNSPFLDLAGVKYLVVAKKDSHDVINKTSNEISYQISQTKYKRVFEDTVSLVLQNLTVMPRVKQFSQYDIKANYLDAQNTLYNNYDFRNRIILNKVPAPSPSKPGTNDNVEIINYSSNNVTIKSYSQGNSIVMLTDAYYPGWEVNIDGRKTQILVADGIYRAVSVPDGQHIIVFTYKPYSFKYGLLITLGSSLILEAYQIINYLKRKGLKQ